MSLPDNLDTLVERVLTRAGAPLTAAAIRKALPAGFKPTAQELVDRLRSLADASRIFRWPGRSEKFSAADAHAVVRDQVRSVLTAGPLTEAEIKKALSKPVQPLLKAGLASLVAAGIARRHPKLGRRVPYGLGPPDPLDYLPGAIEAAFKPLIKLGFTDSDLRAALRRYAASPDEAATSSGPEEPDAGQAILGAMLQLNGQAMQGALVYVSALRGALEERFPDKASFDRAVLALAAQGRVQLQTHAWPGTLSASEKDALIENGRGGYFDAIGLRLE